MIDVKIGEMYYFEWAGNSAVARCNENRWFCCSWGGCSVENPEINVLRLATDEERKEFDERIAS